MRARAVLTEMPRAEMPPAHAALVRRYVDVDEVGGRLACRVTPRGHENDVPEVRVMLAAYIESAWSLYSALNG